ncbi:MAG: cysteine--tRNA ligase [Pseudomonadota bacterium]
MLKFYNTLTLKLDEFKEIEPGIVKMYTCGPTVYNFAHIGNLRTFMFEDILRRYLKYKGYKVIQVMNITDVEDKTIRESKKEGVSLKEFTKKYTKAFFEDLDTLKIERAEHYPLATDHIQEMINIILKLKEKGFTYESDGSVYFTISKFKEYGKLSHIDIEKTKTGSRYDADEYEKDDARDFVLWKKKKEAEPFWKSPFGEGRPGWHIECSAMSQKYLGESFDIHTGGVDNIFPHHENEIAQSEAANDKKFVNYWLHSAHLTMKKEKMSKSEGNFLNLRDLMDKGIDPIAIRYFLLSAHYRAPLNYGIEELEAASKSCARINEFIENVKNSKGDGLETLDIKIETCLKKYEEFLDDDLNISGALGSLFTFIKEINPDVIAGKTSENDAQKIIALLEKINQVLDVITFPKEASLDEEVEKLIKQRQDARINKDFALADQIRDKLNDMGIILKDTPQGIRWEKKK